MTVGPGHYAVLSAIVGYLLGLAGSFLCAQAAERSGAAIALPWQLALGMFGVTLLMCLTAAFTSIHKVTRLEPVMVFRS